MSASQQPQARAPGQDIAAIRHAGRTTAVQAGGQMVKDYFALHRDSLAKVVPSGTSPDRIMSIALRAFNANPTLRECTINSLFAATITCAMLGLEPNTPLQHIHLIPRKNNRKGTVEVQIVLGFQGLLELARRSGQIETIAARAVYSNDPFDIEYGVADTILHKPAKVGDRGEMIGCYAVAKLKGGGYQFEWMTVGEINRVRDASDGYRVAMEQAAKYKRPPKGNPWIEHFEAMARKTLIRRICKYLPISVDMAAAVELDEKQDRGENQGLHKILDGVDFVEVAVTTDDDDDAGAPAGAAPAAQETANSGTPATVPAQAPEQIGSSRAREVPSAEVATPNEQRAEPPLPLRGGTTRHAPAREEARRPEPEQQPSEPPPADDGFGGME